MHVIVAYDVDFRESVKLRKILDCYCFRAQRSVYEGELTKSQYDDLVNRIVSCKLSETSTVLTWTILSSEAVRKTELMSSLNTKNVCIL